MSKPSCANRFPFLDHPKPLAFAHRGGALEAVENTMSAFSAAVDLGYPFIETDIQASRDGVPVIFHDDTLDRLAGVPGRIADYTWEELKKLSLMEGEALVRLEDLLESFPAVHVNLEPKTDAAVVPMADAVRRCNALDRVCVGSFDTRRTRIARQVLGENLCWSPSYRGVIALWMAGWGWPIGQLDFPVVQVPPRYFGIPVVIPRFIKAAHARGIQVHVWTVDDPVEMERFLDMGVDGLMTDRPLVLKDVLMRRGQWQGL